MTRALARPIRASYWVEPDHFVAGEYPGAKDEAVARKELRSLLDFGVTFFLDVTEEGEGGLLPYVGLLQQEAIAIGRGGEHRRTSIQDLSTPTVTRMRRILGTMDGALRRGHTVYVHCWGGIGRTGTVVGCYLVRQGLSSDASLKQMQELLQDTPKRGRASPETPEQRRMILDWHREEGWKRRLPVD